MPARREDYSLTLVRQVAEALRRLREVLRVNGDTAAVIRDAEATVDELLGPRHKLLASLDAASAAALVADARRVTLWADLLRVQADARRRLGDDDGARILARRADSLVQALAAGEFPDALS